VKIGINRENAPGENRVAASPDLISKLSSAGHVVMMQRGAGAKAGFSDDTYEEAGASLGDSANEVAEISDMLLHVGKPSYAEIEAMPNGTAIAATLDARRDAEIVDALAKARATAFAMDLVPRIARAQSMDVLSSQASIAGYKCALMAADSLGRFFPMMMTAAGTIPPARVLILGAGVAGLQAVATAKRLGAEVYAFDVRAAAGEQVESLGAKFIAPPDVDDAEAAGGYARAQTEDEGARQRRLLAEHVVRADAVIATAAIPGRPAPLLIENETVSAMRPGSVVIDLAAETGGNVETTIAGEDVMVNGVTVKGPLNVPSSMPYHASVTYARNLESLLNLIVGDGLVLDLDFDDEVVDAMCVTHDGEVRGHTIGR
jgi:NAD(P) transhydrogenase subunit alpha